MIQIREGLLGLGVYASQAMPPRTVILQGRGEPTRTRTRHSIQVDHDVHVVVDSPIRFINHSCDPNCGLLIPRGATVLEVHALRTIARGEELTIDYATFEDEIRFMESPCLCRSAACRGEIVGYVGLPEARREALGPFIAEYLRTPSPRGVASGSAGR